MIVDIHRDDKTHKYSVIDDETGEVLFETTSLDRAEAIVHSMPDWDFEEDLEVYGGYSRRELSKAFDKVRNPDDWKAPISAWVPRHDMFVVQAAVEFYTATEPKVTVYPDMVHVQSIGYRSGPAGDH